MKPTISCERCLRVAVLSKSKRTWVCTICGHREKVKWPDRVY